MVSLTENALKRVYAHVSHVTIMSCDVSFIRCPRAESDVENGEEASLSEVCPPGRELSGANCR